MFLHGFIHRDDSAHHGAGPRLRAKFMTASEGEFLGLGQGEACNGSSKGEHWSKT